MVPAPAAWRLPTVWRWAREPFFFAFLEAITFQTGSHRAPGDFRPGGASKPLILDETCRNLTILHIILAERCWNLRFQRLILWCVLDNCRKKYQFYGVFWGRRELSTVEYIRYFLKFQTVWCESIGDELPRGGGRTHARTDARRNNQLWAQPSGEMHENEFE